YLWLISQEVWNRGAIRNISDPRCIAGQEDCPRLPPTDPDQLAIRSLQDAASVVVTRILSRDLERQEIGLIPEEHYIGVVLFGSDAATALPLSRVQVETDANGTITANIDETLQALSAGRNLGDTNFDAAMDEACRILNCTTPPPAGRTRVVVILTDGQPTGADRTNPGPYYDNLFPQHDALINSSTIWVIGLDRQDEFWSANQPFWERIAPERTKRVTNPNDIAKRFEEIARASIGETDFGDYRACDGSTFAVAPYLERLTLILQYPDTDSRARFVDAQGNEVTGGGKIYYRSGSQSETYTISNPVPGDWKCEIVGSSVEPQFTDIVGAFQFADMRVEETGDLVASTCRDFSLAVSYFDVNDTVIEELPDYPLQHTLTVSIPENVQTRPLINDNGRDDRWIINGPITPDSAGGSYPVAVNVMLENGTPIFSDVDTIRIDPDLPCIEEIIQPQTGSTIEMHNRFTLSRLSLKCY
ncbi:VWA domain-containing protein, partial [bacterium]|nr:VWA domain-containing protein [bacterium]